MPDWMKTNDALMHAALKKIGLVFTRNKKTREVDVRTPHMPKCYFGMSSFDENDDIVGEGPDTPESLGTIKYFYGQQFNGKLISNIFFGVKSYEELKMKLDLMA